MEKPLCTAGSEGFHGCQTSRYSAGSPSITSACPSQTSESAHQIHARRPSRSSRARAEARRRSPHVARRAQTRPTPLEHSIHRRCAEGLTRQAATPGQSAPSSPGPTAAARTSAGRRLHRVRDDRNGRETPHERRPLFRVVTEPERRQVEPHVTVACRDQRSSRSSPASTTATIWLTASTTSTCRRYSGENPSRTTSDSR